MSTTVRQVLDQKEFKDVFTIRTTATVFEAIDMMSSYDIGALMVTDNSQVVGIVTERDYARKVILDGRSSKRTKVKEIMSRDVVYVEPETDLENCMAIMTEARIRHLPVIDKGELIGLLSIGDVVKSVVSDQQFMIDQLTGYITGSYTQVYTASNEDIIAANY